MICAFEDTILPGTPRDQPARPHAVVESEDPRASNSVRVMPDEWSDRGRVAEYLSREIPHRQIAEEVLLQALPEQVERFIDLGTGDGRLLALVRGRYPEGEAIGLDPSAPMLERARERFDGDLRVELREHDLRAPLPGTGAVDVVVSGLAIHHREDSRKRELFAETHDLLAPGGVFREPRPRPLSVCAPAQALSPRDRSS